MIKAIFFDLDGTLLPMADEEVFTKSYFKLLCGKFLTLGLDKDVFMHAMLKGLDSMQNNDGSKTNEQAFWEQFDSVIAGGKQKYIGDFEKFYINEFCELKAVCGENPLAKRVIENLKGKYKLVLSTNPLFPRIAINTRLGFVELGADDFDYVSTYENSTFSKSNPKYFEEILQKLKISPNEVLLFGNDVKKDAEFGKNLGLNVCVIEDNLVDPEGNVQSFDHIKFAEIENYLENKF